MKTNFQMLTELLKIYEPKKRGILNTSEFTLIKDTLHLGEMDVLALRNLRDFVVAFLSNKENDTYENLNKMSAITYAIDTQIVKIGGEV